MEAMIEDCAPASGAKTPACRSTKRLAHGRRPAATGALAHRAGKRGALRSRSRARYGDEAIDAANETLLDMDSQTWNDMKELERAILGQLSIA